MRAILSLIFVLTTVTSRSVEVKWTPEVQTTKGPIKGKIQKTIWNGNEFSAFQGIPYAKPPIGNQRFQPPVQIDPWTTTRITTEDGSPCIQLDFVNKSRLTGSEDCLYLNVYTPETTFKNDKLRAVMVWIYGGSFKQGYANYSLYAPDFLIEDDVVVVTFNYRLGALGFLSLDHPEASGNAGLKDQRMVLQWVRDNIDKFGGNPKNVTIFGFSAGAVSVDLHVISEKSKDLFQRSIAMSGSVYSPWAFHTTEVAVGRAFDLLKIMGHETKDKNQALQKLRQLPATEIVLATEKVAKIDLPFKPTVEPAGKSNSATKFLTDNPLNYYKTGNIVKQPHMMGYAEHEMIVFTKPIAHVLEAINKGIATINKFLQSVPFLKSLGLDKYLVLPDTMTIIDFLSDALFVSEIDLKQKVFEEINGKKPVFLYRLSYDSPYSMHKSLFQANLTGASHADDFGYIFHTPIVNVPTEKEHEFSQMRKKITRLLTNFAKFGNPTPNGQADPLLKVSWPPSGPKGLTLDINKELKMHERLASKTAQMAEPIVKIIAPMYTGRSNIFSYLVTKLL